MVVFQSVIASDGYTGSRALLELVQFIVFDLKTGFRRHASSGAGGRLDQVSGRHFGEQHFWIFFGSCGRNELGGFIG